MNDPKSNLNDNLQIRTKQFALRIINLVSSLPNATVSTAIKRQLIRSGTSVAANTRAAFRGRSKKEYRAKLGIVVEEADESLLWMELLVEGKIISKNKINDLMEETNTLISIFVSLLKKKE
ncbi:MAG: four helix bundle protein [Planctomycetia bacterium]|nr:four helix bundle protein [Planctomycetia bacterium]